MKDQEMTTLFLHEYRTEKSKSLYPMIIWQEFTNKW